MAESIITSINIDILKDIVNMSNTMSDMLYLFGMENKGNNYKTLINRIKKDSIDISHIKIGNKSNFKTKPDRV